jgi:hypothetical protein
MNKTEKDEHLYLKGGKIASKFAPTLPQRMSNVILPILCVFGLVFYLMKLENLLTTLTSTFIGSGTCFA